MKRRLTAVALGCLATLALGAGTASAAAPAIINTGTGCAGQTAWLISCATSGETASNANVLRISALVSHDGPNTIASLLTDDDWDGATDPDTVRGATSTKPSIATGYPRSRVNLTYNLPTANTGLSCGFLSGTRRTTDRNARIAARDSASQTSGASSSQIKFTASGQCTGPEDYAFLYGWGAGNFSNAATPGSSVTYTYTGDDPDTTGSSDFQGINWRVRNIRSGAISQGPSVSCPENGDNAEKSLTVSFPNRGAFVVEAELLDGDGCGDNQNGGFWFPIGTADVNSATVPAPALTASRPVINGNTTITATPGTDPDSAAGGGAQVVQFDLDENPGNGVAGFEQDTVAGEGAILSAGQVKTVNTTGQPPGLHTVRARVIDNGAMDAADAIRRTSVTTTATYLVDTPPVVSAASAATESGQSVLVPFSGTDVDGDALTWSIFSGPSNGTLSGSGASRTYTADSTFAGTDSFVFRANDGFGGITSATGTITVRPDTAIASAPSGTINSRGASFQFGSPVTSSATTFECSFDGAPFSACASPVSFSDLADGLHTFSARASIASPALTDPTPATASFTIDAFPAASVDTGPSGTIGTGDVTFGFSSTEAGATPTQTLECRLDDAPWRPCDSPKSLTDVPDGAHTFEVRSTDAFGKVSPPASRAFTVDKTPPVTQILGSPPALTDQDSGEVSFEAGEAGATFECSLDGAAFASCASPEALSGLVDGLHTFRVRATDALGNVEGTPAEATWTVDTAAPQTTITAGPSGPTSDTTPTFEFMSSESGSSFACAIDGATAAPCTSPLTTGPLGEGPHTLAVVAADPATNVDPSEASRSFTVDTSPPGVQVDSGPSGTTSDSTPTFAFSSAEPAATFRCRLDSIDPAAFAPCPASYTSPSLADGPHTLNVLAVDSAGNEGSSVGRSFTVDTQSPETSISFGPSATERSTAAEFRFAASEPGSFLECRLDSASPSAFGPCASPASLTGLGDGAHTFDVRSTDPAGNVEATPASRTWTVDTSAQPPGNQRPPESPAPTPEPCRFGSSRAACGVPSLTAALKAKTATPPVRAATYDLSIAVDSGGAELSAATLALPKALAVAPASKPAAPGAGSIVLGGQTRLTVKLKVPKKRTAALLLGKAGTVKVVLRGKRGPRLEVTGIPAGVTAISGKLLGRRSSLLSSSKSCSTLAATLSLKDRFGGSSTARGLADLACRRGGAK